MCIGDDEPSPHAPSNVEYHIKSKQTHMSYIAKIVQQMMSTLEPEPTQQRGYADEA
jgi:hypothetical protein